MTGGGCPRDEVQVPCQPLTPSLCWFSDAVLCPVRCYQYINRVRANIHIVLCMSPLGEAFRTRLRMFPSIVNCCTIDWFMEWPEEVGGYGLPPDKIEAGGVGDRKIWV